MSFNVKTFTDWNNESLSRQSYILIIKDFFIISHMSPKIYFICFTFLACYIYIFLSATRFQLLIFIFFICDTFLARYTTTTFISALGGALGAWMGFSVCMIFEVNPYIIFKCTRVAEVGKLSASAKNAFNSFVGRVFANSRQKTLFFRVLPKLQQKGTFYLVFT